MILIYLYLVILTVSAVGAEDLCIPVMKMKNVEELESKTQCVTKEFVDTLVKELYVNLSSVIMDSQHKYGNDCATTDDIERLKKMNEDIIAKLEREHACHESSQTNHSIRNPVDCQDILNQGHNTTGTYTIYPGEGAEAVSVSCDMDTVPGGWTVFQRRISDSDFYKTWNEYESGFGNLSTNFWLGNRYIHILTNQGKCGLRVDLTSMEGETAYASYEHFSVGDAESYYKLTVSGYSGTAGDSLTSRGNEMKFSTYDVDNDVYSGHCAVMYHGAWWYDECHTSNLNGEYGSTQYARGPVWSPWKGYYAPMEITEMKIRCIM